MSETFGQRIAVAFLDACDAPVELGVYADAVDELVAVALEHTRGLQLEELQRVVGELRPRGRARTSADLRRRDVDLEKVVEVIAWLQRSAAHVVEARAQLARAVGIGGDS